MTPTNPFGRRRRSEEDSPGRHPKRLRRLLGDWRIVIPLAAAPLALVAATLWIGDSGPSEASQHPEADPSAARDTPGNEPSSEGPPRPSHQHGDSPAEELAEAATLALRGEPASAGDLTVTVDEAAVTEGAGGRYHLAVSVTLANDSDDPQPYSLDAFFLIADRGAVVQPLPSRTEDALGSGNLEVGQTLSGTMEFPAGAGTHTLVYEARDGGARSRIVWVVEA